MELSPSPGQRHRIALRTELHRITSRRLKIQMSLKNLFKVPSENEASVKRQWCHPLLAGISNQPSATTELSVSSLCIYLTLSSAGKRCRTFPLTFVILALSCAVGWAMAGRGGELREWTQAMIFYLCLPVEVFSAFAALHICKTVSDITTMGKPAQTSRQS